MTAINVRTTTMAPAASTQVEPWSATKKGVVIGSAIGATLSIFAAATLIARGQVRGGAEMLGTVLGMGVATGIGAGLGAAIGAAIDH